MKRNSLGFLMLITYFSVVITISLQVAFFDIETAKPAGFATSGEAHLFVVGLSEAPALSVQVESSPDPVFNGSVLTLTVTLNNSASTNASNVSLFANYSEFTTFFNSSIAPNSSNNTWFFAVIPNGSSIVFTIDLLVDDDTPAGTNITNTLNVSFFNGTDTDTAVVSTSVSSAVPFAAPAEDEVDGGGGAGPSTTVCYDECTSEGTLVCFGDMVRECYEDVASGCKRWRIRDICSVDEYCSSGACLCEEEWECSEWSECRKGTQSRTCEDVNNCGTEDERPGMVRECVPSCSDGILNNNEEGVDCGGPCPECLEPQLQITKADLKMNYFFLVLEQMMLCFWIPVFLVVIILVGCIMYGKEEDEEDEIEKTLRGDFGFD